MHRSRLAVVLIDHPRSLADEDRAFWRGALGATTPAARTSDADGDDRYGHLVDLNQGLVLDHQRLDDESAARIHVDFETDDVAAEVARLEALGATRVRELDGWWQMADPAGLLFCVVPVQSDSFPLGATDWP